MKRFAAGVAIALIASGPAFAQFAVEPADPVAAQIQNVQRDLQKESNRVFDTLRRQDARRQDLADVASDTRAEAIVSEGRARLRQLDEAEVERLRAQLRLERLEREAEVRRRYR